MRLYELAKELDVDNKTVLELCEQVGIFGKSSHSNSVNDIEADKIRRFVLRKSAGESAAGVREVSKEGKIVTESRMAGNVIRRRKKADSPDENSGTNTDLAARIDLSAVPSPDLPSLSPDLDQEKRSKEAALREADALFAKTPETEAAADDTAGDETAGDLSVDTVAEAEDSGLAETTAADADAAAALAAGNAASARLDETRKRHDIRAPRILGKIDLSTVTPKKPTEEAKPAARAGASRLGSKSIAFTATADEARKGDKRRGKVVGRPDDTDADGGKKPRKKQVLRKDELLDYDGEKEFWKTKKKVKKKSGGDPSSDAAPMKQSKRVVKIPGHISVGELAHQMSVKVSEVIQVLMRLGVMAGINQLIDPETAAIVAGEFDYTVTNTEEDLEGTVALHSQEDPPESLVMRPPVVTVMGHVDHGKTSLLDRIRKSSVTAGEFGGITQHIGAYNVKLSSGASVTFLDTPGHEAFTAMRSRGAKITDIVVLVVAADDGVMPQTIEALNHAKAAGVPIIVAVNKIDKDGANRDRVVNQLSEHGLIPEAWGGDTIFCYLSALTGEGVPELLENLHIQAEILELKANPGRTAVGTVIESKIDKGRGPVVTVLIQKGTLRRGDVFVSGAVFGRVRAMNGDDGTKIDEVGPSIPAEVLGASAAPMAGDDFIVFDNEQQARSIAERREQARRIKELATVDKGVVNTAALTLERFSAMVADQADIKELPLIVKGDVQGSVEAVSEALGRLANDEARTKVIHKGVGAISETDVQLAQASGAILIAFNVRADSRASQQIEAAGLQVLYSRIIYELVEKVDASLRGMKAPVYKETSLGRVEVRQTFKVPKLGTVAGSYVLDGTVSRGAMVRLLRDSKVVFEGKMSSLRRFKDDVKEVAAGYECGIGLEGYNDIKEGDVLEVYKVEEVRA
jgi:translation initiation factor IF-2